MISRASLFTVCSLLMLVSMTANAAEIVRLVSGGPSALQVLAPVKADLEKAAGATIEMSVNPNDVAMKGLIKDIVDIVVGPTLEEILTTAEAKGAPKQNRDDFEAHAFFQSTIKIGIHPSNPTTKFTREQITGILSGKVKNWKEINGQDMPLKAFVAKNYLSSMKAIAKFYLNGAEITGANQVLDKDGLLRSVQKEPGAIGFFTTRDKLGDFEPKFFVTEVSRSNYVIIKKKTRPETRKAFEFIKAMKVIQD